MQTFTGRKSTITDQNFSTKLNEANDYCMRLTHNEKSDTTRKNRAKALRLLKKIMLKLNPTIVDSKHANTLVWCAVSLIEYFHFSITAKECATQIPKKKKKRLEDSFNLLSSIVQSLTNYSYTIYGTIMTFLTDANLWQTECLCAEIIKRLMTCATACTETVSLIFDILERHPLENQNEGRQIIRVLCKVLEDTQWTEFDIVIINKFLTMYYHSVKSKSADYHKYSHLNRGLESCIKTIIKHSSPQHILMIIEIVIEWALEIDGPEQSLYEFGTILQYATTKHGATIYKLSINDTLFANIVTLIESSNSISSLLGHKMLQNMIDRNKNVPQLDVPKIYFSELDYHLRVAFLKQDDKDFIKKHRKELHACVLKCVKQHGQHRGLVETMFTTLALLLVEIKCGFTAASVVCIAMNIQEYVLSPEFKHELSCSHRLHAMVISILSLVCWLFKAQVFYDYLYDVMKSRAYFAPFLNPPIRYRYQYAEHNILWNKKELFFEDWQVRYGMWNCFRPVQYSDNMLSFSLSTKKF